MVQSQGEKLCQSQSPEQKLQLPVKKEIRYLTNVSKKDKLAASGPEDENERSKLGNTNTSQLLTLSGLYRDREWIQSIEKKNSCKAQRLYICDKDHFFRGEEFYGYKETSHKIGPLAGQDSSHLLSLVTSKQYIQLKTLGYDIYVLSDDATEEVSNKSHSLIYPTAFLHLPEPEGKDAVNCEDLSPLPIPGKPFNHGFGVTNRSRIEDIPARKGKPKKAPQRSGHVQKYYTEQLKQYSPSDLKKEFLYSSTYTDSETKKNLLYSYVDGYFSSSYMDSQGEDVGGDKMVVFYHLRGFLTIVLSIRSHDPSQEGLEIYHLYFASKTSKCPSDYLDVRIKSIAGAQIIDENRQVWRDSGRDIPDCPGEQLKDEDLEDFEGNAIDKNFGTQCGFKGKNSISLFLGADKRHGEDHPQEDWRNIRVDPMLKIMAAHLRCHPHTTSNCSKPQKEHSGSGEQDIFSSVSQEVNPGEENDENRRDEVGSLRGDQSAPTEDYTEHKDSPAGQTEGTEQHNVKETTEHVTTSVSKSFKDSDTSGETSHHTMSREASTSPPVFTDGSISSSTPQKDEIPSEGAIAKESAGKNVSKSEHEPNTGKVLATNDTTTQLEHLKEDAETDCNTTAFAADHHVVDPVTHDNPSSLPFRQTSLERTSGGTPGVHLHAPVQVSCMDSEHSHVTNSDYCHESCERSSVTPDEDRRAYCNENFPMIMTQYAQRSQSHIGLGAYGGHTSVVAQEQGSYFHMVPSPEDGLGPGVAEETVFLFSAQEHPSEHHDSHQLTQSHFSTPQDPAFPENRTQSESQPQSESASSSHPITLPSEFSSCSSPVQSNMTSSPHSVQRLLPVTVHAASSLPPWATRTACIDLTRATNREFVQLRKRRATYGDDWPNHSGIDAANMALSGFFRIDQEHTVRCFYCGLELDYLTSAHNIWDEHVRQRPDCQYLVAVMGREFVQQALSHLRDKHS